MQDEGVWSGRLGSAGVVHRTLLVEPEPDTRTSLRQALSGVTRLIAVADFNAARLLLRSFEPDLVIANLRLDAYNGMHLAILADPSCTRSIVYVDGHNPSIARDVQAAGAFYERLKALQFAVRAYARAKSLPVHDLRNAEVLDRRGAFRGGRRASDVITLYP